METTDDEWDNGLAKTGYTCLYNNDPLLFGDDVVVFHVVAASNSKRQDMPVGPDGTTLLWAPKFVSLEAWNSIADSLRKEVEDEDRSLVASEHSICDCEFCESGIQHGELYILAVWGQIHLSKRRPNGESGGHTFEAIDPAPTAICLSCYELCHERVFGAWDYPIRQNEECEVGTLTRCWRSGCPASESRGCDISRKPRHN